MISFNECLVFLKELKIYLRRWVHVLRSSKNKQRDELGPKPWQAHEKWGKNAPFFSHFSKWHLSFVFLGIFYALKIHHKRRVLWILRGSLVGWHGGISITDAKKRRRWFNGEHLLPSDIHGILEQGNLPGLITRQWIEKAEGNKTANIKYWRLYIS